MPIKNFGIAQNLRFVHIPKLVCHTFLRLPQFQKPMTTPSINKKSKKNPHTGNSFINPFNSRMRKHFTQKTKTFEFLLIMLPRLPIET